MTIISHAVERSISIDNFGDCAVEWASVKVPLDSIVGLLTHESKPTIEYYHKGEKKTAVLNLEDPDKPGYPKRPAVAEVHPPLEKLDFEVVCLLFVRFSAIVSLSNDAHRYSDACFNH